MAGCGLKKKRTKAYKDGGMVKEDGPEAMGRFNRPQSLRWDEKGGTSYGGGGKKPRNKKNK